MVELNLDNLSNKNIKPNKFNREAKKSSKSLKSKYFTKKIKTGNEGKLKHDVPQEYKESIYYNTNNFIKVSKNIMKSVL